jgi:ABC-type dipeptide/oligopeptide/nickel transport system permease subunit
MLVSTLFNGFTGLMSAYFQTTNQPVQTTIMSFAQGSLFIPVILVAQALFGGFCISPRNGALGFPQGISFIHMRSWGDVLRLRRFPPESRIDSWLRGDTPLFSPDSAVF